MRPSVQETEKDVIDIWPYADPASRLENIAAESWATANAKHVYRSSDGRFEHVLIGFGKKNFFLALVVNLEQQTIHGYRRLDLIEEYGLTEQEL